MGTGSDAGPGPGPGPSGLRVSDRSTTRGRQVDSGSSLALPATSPTLHHQPAHRSYMRTLRDDDSDDGSDDYRDDAYAPSISSRPAPQRVLAERSPTPTLASASEASQVLARAAPHVARRPSRPTSASLSGALSAAAGARGYQGSELDDDGEDGLEDDDADEEMQAQPPTPPIPTPTPVTPRTIATPVGAPLDDERDERDTIKVLITTDNHVGYLESDPVRGQDALNSFREALQIAQREQVDMVFLAGDLFHDNNPSRNTLHQVIGALREYTMGDRPVSLAYMSDPREFAHSKYKYVSPVSACSPCTPADMVQIWCRQLHGKLLQCLDSCIRHPRKSR